MRILKGKQKRPAKLLLYGVEGIGKSTLAAAFPRPLIVDTEDRTAHIDCDRVMARKYSDVTEVLGAIGETDYQTIVIDTVDWLESLIGAHVCTAHNKQSIEDFGYGKGFKFVADEFRNFLQKLQVVQHMNGVHVLLTAHSKIKRFDDPTQESGYDRYQLKCSDAVSALCMEWVDTALFCNYQTVVQKDEVTKRVKAQGGRKRMMYSNHCAAYDAKNSWGLPDEMRMEFDSISAHIIYCPPNEDFATRDQIGHMKAEAIARTREAGLTPEWLKELLDGRMFESFTLDEATQFMEELQLAIKAEEIPE